MTIRTRLILLVVAAMIAIMAVGVIGVRGIVSGQHGIGEVGLNSLPSVTNTLTLKESMTALSRANYSILAIDLADPLETKLAELTQNLKEKREARARLDQAAKAYEPLTFSDFEKEHWKLAKEALADWDSMDSAIVAAAEQILATRSDEGITQLYNDMKQSVDRRNEIFVKIAAQLTQLAEWNAKDAEKTYLSAKNKAEFAYNLAIGIFVLAAIVLIVFGVYIQRSVMRPINLCREGMHSIIQNNDLTYRIKYKLHDEMGALVDALNSLLEKMQLSLREIQHNMEETDKAAHLLTEAADDVAQNASVQSSSSSSMAASVEEMTVSINTVSENANQTRQLANDSEKTSLEGGQIIDQTTAEMENIAQSVSDASRVIESLGEASQQISAVVQVIKEVADQTNLLALNAAIEAARAGEQGRGFAVVADEVRKLAERTSASTSEIGDMIGKIQNAASDSVREMERVVSQVHNGQALAKDAGVCIHGIRDAVRKVTNSVTEISVALKEQSAASNDIARNVEQIAQMTDKNLALSEDTAGNAHRLEKLSASVSQIINGFKV